MEQIYQYLDNVKAEMEKLQADFHTKTELYESLRESHTAQSLKLEEAQLQIEKQAQVIDAKSEEILESRKTIGDLRTSLQEKDFSLRHLSSLNEKLHADCEEKLCKLEDENQEMAMALDEAFAKNKELNQKLSENNKEVSCLKRLLAESENKNLKVGKKVEASKELRDKRKEKVTQETQIEVENLNFAVEMLKEENFIILTVLQSEFSEAYSNLWKGKAELELLNKENEDKMKSLTEQLEISRSALSKTNLYLEDYHLEVSSFLEKVKLLDLQKLQPTISEEALERPDELLANQIQLNKQAPEVKKIVKDDRGNGFESLEKSKVTLPDSICASQEALQLCASPKAKDLEAEFFRNESGNDQKNIAGVSEKLEIEKGILLQDSMRGYTEKDLIGQFEDICDRISEFYSEDVELMKILEKILQSDERA